MRIPGSLSAAVITLSLFVITPESRAQTMQLAQTPPMGWNSWNFFHERVTDKDIRNAADAMVASGIKEAGFEFVNIDDTWEGERDANGVCTRTRSFLT
jgi:alpha-galactosidase